MTPEELLEAQRNQTPLVWSPPSRKPLHEIVTVYPYGDAFFRWDQNYVAQIQRISGDGTTVRTENLRIATAQDLLEYGDTP